MLHGAFLATARQAALAAAIIGLLSTGLAQPAFAAISITRAELKGTQLKVDGQGAAPNAAISVDGVAVGTSDANGAFKIQKDPFSSPTCKITVSDGSSSAQATLTGCTPSQSSQPSTPSLTNVGIFGRVTSGGAKGYVVLSSQSSTCCLTVYLSSSHTSVLLPPNITIAPACNGCSPATIKAFWIWLGCDADPKTVTISATLNGVTKSTTFNVSGTSPTTSTCNLILDLADSLHVPDDGAKYSSSQVEVRARSTDSTATLHVFTWTCCTYGSDYHYIGTLANKGGGNYEGKFYWPNLVNYEIYVGSTKGGCFFKQVNRVYPGNPC